MNLVTSTRNPADAVYRHEIPAGEPWMFEIKQGQTLRLLDLEGNQAVDTLFYHADNPRERYDAQRTLRRQGNVYLTTGSVLYSNLGNPLLTIVADTCGRHDTLGGACAQESNTVRYALDKRYMHSCRDNFLCACLHDGRLHKRDIATMASTTKYQPAPQSDPDDDYTHAPPAYAAGSSSNDETQGLFGPPRSSEDNIPDDFKVCSYWMRRHP